MATSKDYCNSILDTLDMANLIARPMMGEFLLYYQGVLVGGIYDEQLLIKETSSNAEKHLPQIVPYEGAKRTMYLVEDIDNKTCARDIILAAYQDLSSVPTKSKRARKPKSS